VDIGVFDLRIAAEYAEFFDWNSEVSDRATGALKTPTVSPEGLQGGN